MLANYFSLKMKHDFQIHSMSPPLTAQVKYLLYPSWIHTLEVKGGESTLSIHLLPSFGDTHKTQNVHLEN